MKRKHEKIFKYECYVESIDEFIIVEFEAYSDDKKYWDVIISVEGDDVTIRTVRRNIKDLYMNTMNLIDEFLEGLQ